MSDGHLTLICAHCNLETPAGDWECLNARMLGDGSVCLSCVRCDRDLAVISYPVEEAA